MLITSKGINALKIMADLARQNGDGFVSLSDIAARQGESQKYLEASAAELLSYGLVESARGKMGGYRLTRKPGSYTAAEILLAGEGSLASIHCLEDGVSCERAAECVTQPFFKELDDVIMNFLNSKTLADIAKQ